MGKMFRFFIVCIATAPIGWLGGLAVFFAVSVGNALLRCSRPLFIPENETNPSIRNMKNHTGSCAVKVLFRPVARSGVQRCPRRNLFNGGKEQELSNKTITETI